MRNLWGQSSGQERPPRTSSVSTVDFPVIRLPRSMCHTGRRFEYVNGHAIAATNTELWPGRAYLELALLDDGHARNPAVVVPDFLLQLLNVLEVDVVDDLRKSSVFSVPLL